MKVVRKSKYQDTPARILMLVHHEPEADPRIRWVTELCSTLGRTDVIGFIFEMNRTKPLREYSGSIYTERIFAADYPKSSLVWVLETMQRFLRPKQVALKIISRILGKVMRQLDQTENGQKIITVLLAAKKRALTAISGGTKDEAGEKMELAVSGRGRPNSVDIQIEKCSQIEKEKKSLVDYLKSIHHWLGIVYSLNVIPDALFQRARATSIIPSVLICHDIYALRAAVKYKRMFGSLVIYDSHEFWPEADLQALAWEKKRIENLERELVRDADAVITVNPQIASHLEELYQLKNVVSVPNAEPLPSDLKRVQKNLKYPIKFLIQGWATPGRGIEELLGIWQTMDDERVVLVIRSPENSFLACLRQRFWTSVEKGGLIFEPPVSASELVRAANTADVGVIPYPGPNLNHIYACPNKLSQYMQAGLAIFHHSDQVFVSQVVEKYQCGLSFDTARPDTILQAVFSLAADLEILKKYQDNAFQAANSEFNWEVQSKPYLDVLKHFYLGQRASHN